MYVEYESLLRNKTWSLVPLPLGNNLVSCKWVYKTKFTVEGQIEKNKARLVAKGFNQLEGPISQSNKKVKTLSLSSCEAEYREAKEAGKEVVWLWHVLTELGLVSKSSTMLKCDNQGAIQLAYNSLYHSKTKHLDLDAHYIRGVVVDHIISLDYCPTKQQATNIFTKSLKEAKYVHLCSLLGMREVVIKGEQ
eukprot:PITA_14025